ncbi:MAG: 4-hydroxy-tetrahydrodipicolinate synthase [Lachnospiraceae bacterium]|nr:4-hydroxy-tetrahydrodipicolinate synthase [Lachnospiraceae bacterium]
MSVFEGAAVAITTPFKADGSIDFDSFGRHIEMQIEGGTDAIVVCGTTGEASTLTHEEHLDTIAYCVKKVAGRIPVIAGTGSNCTQTAVYLSTEAEKLGADALLVVSPYYNKATQKGLKEHFTIIAESVKIPVILYNIPGRTGVTIAPQTVVDLCTQVPNIVGVKDATGNLGLIMTLFGLAKGQVDVYSGNDDQVLPLLALGGKGVISVLSNIAPRQVHDMCQNFFDGNVQESRRIQLESLELIDALFCEVNPIPVKMAMELLGIYDSNLRRPLTKMEAANAARLSEAMKNYGLIK